MVFKEVLLGYSIGCLNQIFYAESERPMMIMPLILPPPPRNSGRGPRPSAKSLAATFIAFLIFASIYGFLIAALIHLASVDIDKVVRAWYGLPAVISMCAFYIGAVGYTTWVVADLADRKWGRNIEAIQSRAAGNLQ